MKHVKEIIQQQTKHIITTNDAFTEIQKGILLVSFCDMETRNGDFIPISQMTTSHIENSINMILKSNQVTGLLRQ